MPDLESPDVSSTQPQPTGWRGVLARHPWLVFVLPLAVYLLVGSLEPTPTKPDETAVTFGIPYGYYPLIYTTKLLLTAITVVLVLPGYAGFPFRLSWLSPVVGVLGAVLWVGLCKLQLEQQLLVPLGLGEFLGLGTRSAFNPLEQYADHPLAAWGFLSLRLLGLVVLVPVIEEFFLRAFVMRYVMAQDWWRIPFGQVDATAVVVGTVVPMLMHPAELVATAVWFSLVTWLMVRTRSIWDCIAAHAVTNLLLGVYVVVSGDWWLM